MGRPRNEDGGLHRLRLSNWKGKSACWVFGRRWTFGEWDAKADKPTPEAESKFLRQLQLWAASPANRKRDAEPLLIELWADWRASPRSPRNRLGEFERLEKALFGSMEAPGPHLTTQVSDFGSAELEAWQHGLCELRRPDGTQRLGRYTVNRYVSLVRSCIEWGVVVGRAEQSQAQELSLVTPPNRGAVKEKRPRGSVEWHEVDRVAKRLKSAAGDMLWVLWWTGARPKELCTLKVGMIQRGKVVRSAKGAVVEIEKFGVWAAPLKEHKTERHERDRVLFFGPHAKTVLQPLLNRDADAPVFAKSNGEPYTSKQLRDYVKKVCLNMGWRKWSPYSIDHAFLCRVQAAFSSEIPGSGPIAAKAARGHSMRGVTEDYTGADLVTAAKVAAKCG